MTARLAVIDHAQRTQQRLMALFVSLWAELPAEVGILMENFALYRLQTLAAGCKLFFCALICIFFCIFCLNFFCIFFCILLETFSDFWLNFDPFFLRYTFLSVFF